jgi:hypothetical protein
LDREDSVGLWFGSVDDLWKLGKPIGRGGPWKDTPVVAGQPSDPYLMTGYDKKTLTLRTAADTNISIEIDVDHQSGWHRYKSVTLTGGRPWTFVFPAAFNAHWIRFTSDRDCTATALLLYE